MQTPIALECRLDLPRSIVFDALVDPVLVEGWLHPTATLLDGEVLRRDDPAVLEVRTAELGEPSFRLEELPRGTRGSSTLLHLEVATIVEPRFRAPLIAGWRVRLDQLEALLRGHPVDWRHWELQHGDDYQNYLAEAAGT